MLHTFVALVQDKPGVLTRVASLFRRLNINIVSLTVGESERTDISRMTIVCEAPDTPPTASAPRSTSSRSPSTSTRSAAPKPSSASSASSRSPPARRTPRPALPLPDLRARQRLPRPRRRPRPRVHHARDDRRPSKIEGLIQVLTRVRLHHPRSLPHRPHGHAPRPPHQPRPQSPRHPQRQETQPPSPNTLYRSKSSPTNSQTSTKKRRPNDRSRIRPNSLIASALSPQLRPPKWTLTPNFQYSTITQKERRKSWQRPTTTQTQTSPSSRRKKSPSSATARRATPTRSTSRTPASTSASASRRLAQRREGPNSPASKSAPSPKSPHGPTSS